ncbi:hypothetical protein GQ53DRAFT_121287 [Thozetella sp. PMI_491]|nr:hypothetical protein GQ53DRAFT_121287 [Thozetella sp. PMI_491]
MPPSQAANDPEIGISAATHGNGADTAPAAPPGNSAGHATNPPKPSTNTILAGVVDAAKPEILYSSVQNDRINKVLNLATIQRVILVRLQLQIIEESGSLLGSSGEEKTALVDKLKTTMAEYGIRPINMSYVFRKVASGNANRSNYQLKPYGIGSSWGSTKPRREMILYRIPSRSTVDGI